MILEFEKKVSSKGVITYETKVTCNGPKVIDLERADKGRVTLYCRVPGQTEWKYAGDVERVKYDANVVFRIDAGVSEDVEWLIVSGSEVMNGVAV